MASERQPDFLARPRAAGIGKRNEPCVELSVAMPCGGINAEKLRNAEGVRPLFVSYLDYDPRGNVISVSFRREPRGSGRELLYLKLAP